MWGLIKKDLLRRWRNPLSTIVMIAFPLFMSAALGSIYTGGGDGEQAFPRITVLVQNLDEEGFLANALLGALGQDEAQEYLDVIIVGDEGRQMIGEGRGQRPGRPARGLHRAHPGG